MAITNEEMWQAAKVMWESTTMTDRELLEKLVEIYGDEAPNSHTTIGRRRKKENWKKQLVGDAIKRTKSDAPSKKNRPKNAPKNAPKNTADRENNKVDDDAPSDENAPSDAPKQTGLTVWTEVEERIEEAAENLVLDSRAKAAIIRKHRRRIAKLGELQDSTMGTLDTLHGKNLETDGEEIQRIIVVAETSSRTLAQLSATQKIVFEQEMAVCGITVDDFKESEQDRRMKAIEQLAGIAERERLERQKGMAGLQDRLRRFRELEVDELAASAEPTDGNSDCDDDIEDADYSEIDE